MLQYYVRESAVRMIAIAFALLLVSCESFLEVEPPVTRVPAELIFEDDNAATSAIIGLYLKLFDGTNFASANYQAHTALAALSADELKHNRNDPAYVEFQTNNIDPENSALVNLWGTSYLVIYGANAVLEGLESSTGVTAETKNQLRGEAFFIRAYCYFYLVNSFGEVPIALTTSYVTNSKLSRSPVAEVYGQIKSDLMSAEELLSDEYSGPERLRVNKLSATSLLSRIYLYTEDWERAEDKASNVINRSDLYNLPSNLNAVFLASSSEAIWQITSNDQGITHEGALYNGSEAGTRNVLDSAVLLIFEPGDKRKSAWIKKTGKLYVPWKYKKYRVDEGAKEYLVMLRLAEQHLIRAEARARLGKLVGSNSAVSDLDIIRSRAGLPGTSATTFEEIMAAIEKERRLEFLAEGGHRWLDLNRWDRADAVLAPLKPSWNFNDQLYPIPAQELRLNKNLKPQNQGY